MIRSRHARHRPRASGFATLLSATGLVFGLTACGDDGAVATAGSGGGGGATATGSGGEGPGGSGGSTGAGGEGGAPLWSAPACEAAATIDGVAVHTESGPAAAIVPLWDANVLIALGGGSLMRSADSGCTWEEIGSGLIDAAAPLRGGGALALRRTAAGNTVVRIDGSQVTDVGPAPEREGCCRISGLLTDPADRAHVLGIGDLVLWRSRDGGVTWTSSALPDRSEYADIREAAVDPRGLDHFVYSNWEFVWSTNDAGASFEISTFEVEGDVFEEVYAHRLLRSPAAPDTVLAFVFGRTDEAGVPYGAPAGVYRSTDGGARFIATGWPETFGRIALDPRSADAYWAATDRVPQQQDIPPEGTILLHLEGGVETGRVELSPATNAMVFSPAGALHLSRLAAGFGG